MSSFWVWVVALALYALFLAWYVNWRGPLSAAEVTDLIGRMKAASIGRGGADELPTLERFLAEDDGREFFMLNVIRMADGPVADPATGALKPAREVMEGYTRMFLPALFRRGGHPALAARQVGGLVDTWGIEDCPKWSMMGYVRYRSRRDLAQLICDPRFGGAHAFKHAAMPQTFNFPTRPMIMTLAGPRLWVGLILALLAALAQVALLLAASAG
jgi:anti-sigma factor RsiW